MESINLTDYNFTPVSDRKKKKELRTIFILSTLTFEQDTFIENQIGASAPEGDTSAYVLHMGLKGVINFKSQGKDIKAERETEVDPMMPGDVHPWKNEFLSRIPTVERANLALQIRFGKEISEKERKN